MCTTNRLLAALLLVLSLVGIADAQQAVKPVDKYGNPIGSQQNPMTVVPPLSGFAPSTPGFLPTPIYNFRLFGGPFNVPIGMNGDRIKVDQTPSQDQCLMNKKTDVPISQTATSVLVSARPGMSIYVCMVRVDMIAAEVVSWWDGTAVSAGGSANCATATIAHSGSTTTANGESFAAGGGFTSGDGNGSVLTIGPGRDFCLAQNGSNRVSGQISYVYAP